jgi:hypothetical protein
MKMTKVADKCTFIFDFKRDIFKMKFFCQMYLSEELLLILALPGDAA